jgi:hypothetical protein
VRQPAAENDRAGRSRGEDSADAGRNGDATGAPACAAVFLGGI